MSADSEQNVTLPIEVERLDPPEPIRDGGGLTAAELVKLQSKITATEIADFVEGWHDSCDPSGTHDDRLIAAEISKRWGRVEIRSIEDVFAELAKEVPDAEWAKLPADLTDNLDDHLYGPAEGGR